MNINYQEIFDQSPIGLIYSNGHVIVDCNRQACQIFEVDKARLLGNTFEVLYPSSGACNRPGQRMAPLGGGQACYSEKRIMRRLDGGRRDELFWCHVTRRMFDLPSADEAGVWSFEELGVAGPSGQDLTAREREVAAQLLRGLTSKQMGRVLGISHRTVEYYRANLLRKYAANTIGDLICKLSSELQTISTKDC